MRLLILAVVGLALFCIWAYYGMIKIGPRVTRPSGGADPSTVRGLERNLKAHVTTLAGQIGPRNVFNPENLDRAFQYLHRFWEAAGFSVHTEGVTAQGVLCRNLFVEIQGSRPGDQIVIVGAHYDTVAYSPGANDNGSAVACLLELSRMLKGVSLGKTVRFVAFVNEEPPFFKTDRMGSLVHAMGCRGRGEKIIAMLSLETVGYYRQEKGTQRYPFPLSAFYPDRGNFLAIVGNFRSKALVQSFAARFMEESDFPVECAAPFGFITGVDWSDHWAFWEAGYPAIMLTDTALFRYPYYHTTEDTPEKLDYHSLARVTDGVSLALVKMANQTP